ncbi:MAG: response regulator [Myxococcales bacterium]|jgi:CheY-like chemotaxis protein
MGERRAEVGHHSFTRGDGSPRNGSEPNDDRRTAEPEAAPLATPAPRPRLLCLEQTRAGQQIMRGAFEGAGYRVSFADTADQLPELAGRVDPNVIVLELNPKGGRGDDVCRLLKRKAVKLTPIVLVAGIPESELARRARAAGADRYYCKIRGVSGLVELVDDLASEILF